VALTRDSFFFCFYEQVALTRELSGEEMAKLIVGVC
jgi:hypothetical protein